MLNDCIISSIDGEEPTYALFPHLLSREGELEYLRRVSEVFILFFMPRDYTFTVAKCLLREVIACKSKFIINDQSNMFASTSTLINFFLSSFKPCYRCY